ncbi:hypothetical protein MNBD_ALPHA09-501 [hydrothermal vent metagenome]|uniref:Uncharacterized protein n=1 Tax=hydrothermal vent metagenome TaxID=652676 RepID=A0A3B0TFW2_9ZZZZ
MRGKTNGLSPRQVCPRFSAIGILRTNLRIRSLPSKGETGQHDQDAVNHRLYAA